MLDMNPNQRPKSYIICTYKMDPKLWDENFKKRYRDESNGEESMVQFREKLRQQCYLDSMSVFTKCETENLKNALKNNLTSKNYEDCALKHLSYYNTCYYELYSPSSK